MNHGLFPSLRTFVFVRCAGQMARARAWCELSVVGMIGANLFGFPHGTSFWLVNVQCS